MGQAKTKNRQEGMQEEIIKNVASAVRRLAVAASDRLGADCIVHAELAQALLAAEGIRAEIICGFAAWRVGEQDAAVVLHVPMPEAVYAEKEFPFHVWLRVGNRIFDTTTYQLKRKTEELDLLDGAKTKVSWCPDFLYVKEGNVSSFRDTIQGHSGRFFYKEDKAISEKILKTLSFPDEADLQAAEVLYQHPDMIVLGINDWERE